MRPVTLAALLLLLSTTALALGPSNGSTATELFIADDVRTSATYDSGFSGTAWDEFDYFGIGHWWGDGDDLALDGAGTLYFLVHGSGDGVDYHSGIVAFDGVSFRTLNQKQRNQPKNTGQEIRALEVSPVTHGGLKAGHPVFLQSSPPYGGKALVSIDPTKTPAVETVLYTIPSPAADTLDRFALSPDGNIYVLYDGPGSGTIGKLTWNGSAYVETNLSPPSGARTGIVVDEHGDLYTFARSAWGEATQANEILQIDPMTGAEAHYGYVQGGATFYDWAYDADGTLWVALCEVKRKGQTSFVTAAVPGGTTSTGSAIAVSAGSHPLSIAPDGAGSVFVMEQVGEPSGLDEPNSTIGLVVPGDGGGGSGGGMGGKGGGKGK